MNEEALVNFVSNIISFCPPIGRSIGRSGQLFFSRSLIRSLGRPVARSLFGQSFVRSVFRSFVQIFVVSSFLRPFVSLFVYESVGLCIWLIVFNLFPITGATKLGEIVVQCKRRLCWAWKQITGMITFVRICINERWNCKYNETACVSQACSWWRLRFYCVFCSGP